MARTLMACLPRLVRTRSWVPWNKFHSCRFRIVFLFYIEKWYNVCTHKNRLGEAILMRTHIYFHIEENRKDILIIPPDLAHNQPSVARTTPVSNIFHSPKGVRAIEVRLYINIFVPFKIRHHLLKNKVTKVVLLCMNCE